MQKHTCIVMYMYILKWCTCNTSQISSELEVSKSNNAKLTSEMEGLQLRLDALTSKYDSDGKRHQQTIAKLQLQLRERSTRRKVVVTSGEGPSTLSPAPTAPTAAVKPTVTTTPTASIRPMAIQTTSAPTAHVTPTMVTQQHVHTMPPPVSGATVTSAVLTNQIQAPVAAVFVHTTTPQVVTPIINAIPVSSAAASVTSNTSTSTVLHFSTPTSMASSESSTMVSPVPTVSIPLLTTNAGVDQPTEATMTSVASMPTVSSTLMASVDAATVSTIAVPSTTPHISTVTPLATTATSVSSKASPTTTVGKGMQATTTCIGATSVLPSAGAALGVVSSSASTAVLPGEVERKKRNREEERSEPERSEFGIHVTVKYFTGEPWIHTEVYVVD